METQPSFPCLTRLTPVLPAQAGESKASRLQTQPPVIPVASTRLVHPSLPFLSACPFVRPYNGVILSLTLAQRFTIVTPLWHSPNFKNRTLWTGDNLDILRGLNSETVDLIYLDPPFNSNRNYAAPVGSKAAGAAFKDTWTLSDVDLAWHGEIAEANPALYRVIDAAREAHGRGMQSYLIMMAVRLLGDEADC